MDLFVPNNLELQEDGSVIAKDMTKNIVPLKEETFSEFYKRFIKEIANLKDYEKTRQIPLHQKKNLYCIKIFSIPYYLTQKEQDECKAPTLIIEKFFLDRYTAEKWAENKIKQQSIAYYYHKDNPNKRQYKLSYILTNDKENVFACEEAINGKIVKREAKYGC